MSSSENDSNNSGDTRSKGEIQRLAAKNVTVMGISTLLAAIAVIGVLVGANAAFGGPQLVEGIFGFLGMEVPGVFKGPGRAFFTLAFIFLLAWGVDFAGVDTSVPFWIGIALFLLVVGRFILPDWMTAPFGALKIGELFLGIPLGELNVARTVVVGVSFILLYYMSLIRVNGALGSAAPKRQGSTSVSGVLSLTRTRIKTLMRNYVKAVVGIAGILGVAGFFTVTGLGQAGAAFMNQVAGVVTAYPVWSGYLSSLGAWYANNFAPWVPFDLSAPVMAIFLALILLVTAGTYAETS